MDLLRIVQSGGAGRWRVCYQRDLQRLIVLLLRAVWPNLFNNISLLKFYGATNSSFIISDFYLFPSTLIPNIRLRPLIATAGQTSRVKARSLQDVMTGCKESNKSLQCCQTDLQQSLSWLWRQSA